MKEWKDFPYLHMLPLSVTVYKGRYDVLASEMIVFVDSDKHIEIRMPSYMMASDNVMEILKLI